MGIKLFYDFVREQHIAILWTHLWLWKQDGNGLRGSVERTKRWMNEGKKTENISQKNEKWHIKPILACVESPAEGIEELLDDSTPKRA